MRLNNSDKIASLLLFSLLVKLYFQIKVGYPIGSWNVTEFLINYQSGFIRRGLLGELLFQIKDYVDVYVVVLLISVASFAFLTYIMLKIFKKHDMPKWVLLFPFLLGGMILLNSWFRKDAMLLILFYFFIKNISVDKISNKLIALIILTFAMLIHESFVFLAFPYVAVKFLISDYRYRKSILILFPAIGVLYLILNHNGNTDMAVNIWNSWTSEFQIETIKVSDGYIDGSIGALAWSFEEGVSYFFKEWSNFDGGIYSPLFWLGVIIFVYIILVNTLLSKGSYDQKLLFSDIYLIQSLGILPLFVLGWDYGRWMIFWSISSIILFDNLNKADTVSIGKIPLVSNISKFIINKTSQVGFNVYFLVCFFVGFPAFGWKLSYAIDNIPIVNIYRVISLIMKTLLVNFGVV
jgi:hypothetical protein